MKVNELHSDYGRKIERCHGRFGYPLCQEGKGMGSFLGIHCLWKNICRIYRWILMLKVNCEMVDPEDL